MSSKVEIPSCEVCKVRSLSIFKGVTKNDLSEISIKKGCLYFEKKQLIFNEGNTPLGVYIVHAGKVKLTKLGSLGKEQIVGFAKRGEIFGYRSLLSGENHDISATTLTPSSICLLPKEEFFKLLKKDPEFMFRMMKKGFRKMGDITETLINISQKPVRERLAEVLIFLTEYFGYEADSKIIDLELSREEYANIIASTKESCMRVFSSLKKEGIIALHKKKIEILDIAKLKNIAEFYG